MFPPKRLLLLLLFVPPAVEGVLWSVEGGERLSPFLREPWSDGFGPATEKQSNYRPYKNIHDTI